MDYYSTYEMFFAIIGFFYVCLSIPFAFFVLAVWFFNDKVVINLANISFNIYVCLYVRAFFLRVLYLKFRCMHVCIEHLCWTFSVIAEMQLQLYSRIVF